MTQDILKSKIVLFLQHTHKSADAKKIANNIGLCFGLSICHATMKLKGQLKEWEAALQQMIHWDGDIKKLKNKILLPYALQKETLKEIFERVIKAVIFYQEGTEHVSGEKLFTYQRQVLQKGKNILGNEIVQTNAFAGLFALEELTLLLNKDDVNQTICIISNSEHSIAMEYHTPYWVLYDPNYNHDTQSPLYKKFKTKESCVKEINVILGNMIVIKQVAFDHQENQTKKVFDSLIKLKPDIILCALPLVAYDAPKYILPSLQSALQDYDKSIVKNMLANILMTNYHTELRWNGLHCLTRWSPKHLMPILECAAGTNQGKKKITKALFEKNSEGVTAWQMIKEYAPHCISRVNTIITSSKLKKLFSPIQHHSIFNNKENILLNEKENFRQLLR